jgi:hypothetical protein
MSKIVFIPGFVATVTTIVIDSTPIVGGASGRILFENAANQISESANFTYLAGIFNVTKTATHQAQFTFDANNYFRIKATSTGATELSATGTAPEFLFNADVDAQTNKVYAAGVGVGTITPAAILEVLGITEQARFSYNASNRLGVTVASNGAATFSLTGTNPEFSFDKNVNVLTDYPIFIGRGISTSGFNYTNTIIGYNAGLKYRTVANTLINFTVFGARALENATAAATAFGAGALRVMTTGLHNSAFGLEALSQLVSGSHNSAFGSNSQYSAKGSSNSSFGYNALNGATGSDNSTFGFGAGSYLTTGGNNSFFGSQNNNTISTGLFNVVVGKTAPALTLGITTGSYNTIIGSQISGLAASLSNTIILADGQGVIRYYTDSTGKTGFGVTASIGAKLHVISTTEQLRVGYDASNYASFTTGATGSLTIALTGTTPRTTFSQGIDVLGTIKLNGYTVATLPAGVIGETAYVTDALAPIFLGIIAGGGAVVTPVFYNGANWIAQ